MKYIAVQWLNPDLSIRVTDLFSMHDDAPFDAAASLIFDEHMHGYDLQYKYEFESDAKGEIAFVTGFHDKPVAIIEKVKVTPIHTLGATGITTKGEC